MKVLLKVVAIGVSVLIGVVVGALGSVAHWSHRPWGLVAGLALVLAAAATMRAWDGYVPLTGFFVSLGVVLVVLSRPGPGGDLLIHLSDTKLGLTTDPSLYGRIWVGGAVVATALVALAPKVLFSDRPVEPGPTGEVPGTWLDVTPELDETADALDPGLDWSDETPGGVDPELDECADQDGAPGRDDGQPDGQPDAVPDDDAPQRAPGASA
ncbi:MAG: hypothetical protein FWD11_11405 [Micrococcales bacterium]|nr:hypothetical protein [Micrococcales bacterium]